LETKTNFDQQLEIIKTFIKSGTREFVSTQTKGVATTLSEMPLTRPQENTGLVPPPQTTSPFSRAV
jgi:hypothetical protein